MCFSALFRFGPVDYLSADEVIVTAKLKIDELRAGGLRMNAAGVGCQSFFNPTFTKHTFGRRYNLRFSFDFLR
jgi:hypothetical protein